MINRLLDMAQSLEDFKHYEELLAAIELNSVMYDTDYTMNGLRIVLEELHDDISLQRDTLLKTMLNVRNQYAIRCKFRHTMYDMCSLGIAINHVKRLLDIQRNKRKYGVA